MMLIGFVGFHCACAAIAVAKSAVAAMVLSASMSPPPGSLRKIPEHELGHVLQPVRLVTRRKQVALEDRRQRVPVAQVEIAERGDRDVELHRIDAVAKLAIARTSLKQVLKQRN